MIKVWIALLLIWGMSILPNNSLANGVGVRTLYSGTPVDTTTWKVLIANTSDTVSSIYVFDSSGQTLEIGTAPASATANSEVRQLLIPAGGFDQRIQIPIGYRISIRAVSANATVGENDFNVSY